MSRPYENDSLLYKHTNSSEASLSAIPLTLRQLLPRPKPPDENLIDRVQFSPSPATSIETSSRGSPLYMRSTSYPAPTSAKDSPRTRNRRSRQSLSLINNNSLSSPSLDDNDVPQKASQSLAREEIAWKVINREIKEWQNVCHTGRPSWWTPSSKGARRVQSQSSINRDLSTFGQSDWVDQDEYIYYPGLCFEFERRKDTAKDGQPWLQELAYMIAIQLLSSCFTLPVEQFSNCKMGIYLTDDIFGVPEMPDERLISSLRMHTNYRWAPAFGHEARTTSPETHRSASYSGHTSYTPHLTPGGGVQSSPDVHDSSWRKKKKQQHRARHVTPAETEHQQEFWEDTYEKAYGFGESPLRTPTLGSWRDGSWRDRRNMARSASYIPVPGRVVQSAPSTPRMLYRPPILSRHTARSPRDEYPFPITAAVDGAKPARYSIHPHLRSEPHPVFVQPVRELVVKRWRTFRRRFGYSLSHGNPDNTTTTTNTTFTEERRATTWGPPSPASLAPRPSHGVRRRRDAQSRHDIHSSSMESSPRYNTPTSGTHSRTPSGAISPGILYAPPQSSPSVGEVDDLIAAARAITNSSSNIPQEPLTASQPFPVFTPNNTPDHTDEENSPAHITRTEAGYFTSTGSPGGSGPNFVPKVKSSGKRRSGTGTRGSRRASSRLSEVFTQDEVTEEEQKYQATHAAKRKLFDADTFSVLTTPTEESDSDGSKSRLRRGTVVVMSDPPPTSTLSPNLRALVRMDSPSPDQRSNLSGAPLSPQTSITSPRPSSIASVDTDPFAFLSPRRDSPGSSSPYSPCQVRPHRPSHSSMSRMSRNESPITQRRDSPLNSSPAVPDPWSNRPSMSYADRWTPPRISPVSMLRDGSRSPSTTYMSAVDRQPSASPLPPSASDILTGSSMTIRSPQPRGSGNHLSPSMSREDSRSSTASSPAVRPEAIRNRSSSALRIYPQPAMPNLVRGDSRSSTASSPPRPGLQRTVTSFPNIRPSIERAAISWTNTPNNSEEGGRRASWQSHRSMSSNDDAYDPHAVDCHSNLPSARGSQRGSDRGSEAGGLEAMPGRMRTTRTEPMPRREAQKERKREVIAAEARRSASVGARPSTILRSVSTPVVRLALEYEEELRVGLGRNRLSRVSSSGTTHFSSGPEGMEVQGLPVGPLREAWDTVGELGGQVTDGTRSLRSSRRKKARSFL